MVAKREIYEESVGEETVEWGSEFHNGIVPGKNEFWN